MTKMDYKIIEDHTADIGFSVHAKILNDAFSKAAIALTDIMVDVAKIDAKKTIEEALKDDAAKTYPGFEIILLYFDLAYVSNSLGDFKKALDAYDMIIKIAPDTPAAEKAAKDAARLRK